jgi:hypothetical protein
LEDTRDQVIAIQRRLLDHAAEEIKVWKARTYLAEADAGWEQRLVQAEQIFGKLLKEKDEQIAQLKEEIENRL